MTQQKSESPRAQVRRNTELIIYVSDIHTYMTEREKRKERESKSKSKNNLKDKLTAHFWRRRCKKNSVSGIIVQSAKNSVSGIIVQSKKQDYTSTSYCGLLKIIQNSGNPHQLRNLYSLCNVQGSKVFKFS